MTTDRYAALRAAIAAGPTPGRREVRDDHPTRSCIHIGVVGICDEIASLYCAPGDPDMPCVDGVYRGDSRRMANAALIAAADPETIGALLAKGDAVDDLRDVLLRHGFVPCDIPACNCGSWHPRFGLRERMDEITADLDAAGHPLSNENGNLTRNALRQLIAERDALRAALSAQERT